MRLKKIAPFIAASLTLATSQAAVLAGDLAITSWGTNDPDSFSFVTFVDINVAEQINFWDAGYNKDGTNAGDGSGQGTLGGEWRTSESLFGTWTNSSGGVILAGSVINIFDTEGPLAGNANIGSVSGPISGDFSTAGDQIFLGQGQFDSNGFFVGSGGSGNGTLITGIDFDGANNTWASGATSTNTSALPSAITSSAFSIRERDNGQYTGPRTFTSWTEAQDAIKNQANWTTSDTPQGSFDATSFSLVPEPSSFILGVMGTLFLTLRRKR